MRHSSLMVIAMVLALAPHSASAVSCAQETASELMRRGDVAATGVTETSPVGFIFAADRVYKGEVPAHVLVVGQYRPEPPGSRQFVVMRFHLPGLYSMDICDGRPAANARLGPLGEGRPPSPDLPVAQLLVVVAAVAVILIARSRRGQGMPPTAATAAP